MKMKERMCKSVKWSPSIDNDAAEELEQGALAGSVFSDDAEDVALLHFEVDVFESINVIGRTFRTAVVGLANFKVWVFFVADAGTYMMYDV